MKIKDSNKHAVIIIAGILIVILLVILDIRGNKQTNYSNLTEEEIAVEVKKKLMKWNLIQFLQ